MSFTWSNLLSSKLGLCRNGKFSHMSARYDFVFVHNIIYLSFKEGVGVGSEEWGVKGGWGVGGWGVGVDCEGGECEYRSG